jgi:mannose-6-phosphate isomerase-like protein (cupin superfamily)
MSGYLKNFADIPAYQDDGSQNQTCRDVLPRGIVPDLMMGYNILEGPGRTGLANHSAWHQVFVVVQGRGTLLRGDERIPIQSPCVVHIPPNTDHDVLVAPEERIEYVYVNKYLAPEAQK